MSHVAHRRCSKNVGEDVDLVGQRVTGPAAAWAVSSSDGHGGPNRRDERKDGMVLPTPPGHGGVRADLEQVFRSAYPRVVAVAARVLGSRDGAEDVAQEVFLSFGRSSIPPGQATGWLSVAAAHTALNHLRSGRRRTAREEAAGGD